MNKKVANAEKTYHVSPDQLPVSCPGPNTINWNSHPKVYLAVEDTGEAVCEYCGAKYILKK
ncbi:MAG: zinc-finger domain-containing protein [Proteobacteria bacterium]|nr:zinc-finger domain-containing protein [Pseudomonadota bacterium]